MKIGIDLDGVLAEFNQDFHDVLAKVTGRRVPFPKGTPMVWDWPQHELGYSNEEVGKAWAEVTSPGSEFWLDHGNFSDENVALAAALTWNRDHAVYFVTDRGGKQAYAAAKYQSERWLKRRGVQFPTVILSSQKGLVAKALGLGLLIDDKPENLFAVATDSPETRRYLIKAAYNQWAWDDPRLIRVSDIRMVLDMEALRGENIEEGNPHQGQADGRREGVEAGTV